MKNPIKLNSQEWCDIVFNGKNKSYGAYEMRMSSSKRHIAAFVVTLGLPILIILAATIIGKVQAANRDRTENINVEIIMDNLTMENPIEEVIEVTVPEPPKPIVNSIRFIPPVIGADIDVIDENVITMEDVVTDTRVVGYIDVIEGTDDRSHELARDEDVAIVTETPQGPIDFAEVMPQFPGGEAEMMSYVGKNLRYPTIDQENGTQGRVIVRFVVTKTGAIDQVEIMRGISPTADREAMRVVKSMPKWIPGKQNGKPVAVYFNLPVLYRLK